MNLGISAGFFYPFAESAKHSLAINTFALAGVSGRDCLLAKIGDVGRGRPDVALGTDFSVGEEAVEQSEARGERMMIGRNGLSEENQRWIAVAFFQVSEHLIIGTILFDDVDHMLKRRIWLANALDLPVIRHCDPL